MDSARRTDTGSVIWMWRIAIKIAVVSGFLAFIASSQPVSAQLAERALGVWADEDGASNIEITPCGDYLCGQVVWLKHATDASGRPQTDDKNPDESLRSRPILGLTIIEGLKPDDNNTRLKGRVYNADDGKSYDLYLEPQGETMSVEGCFFLILCGTQTWTRVR